MRAEVELDLVGVPQPQGSKTAYKTPSGRVVLVEGKSPAARRAFKDWRGGVADRAAEALAERDGPIDGPCLVHVTFRLPKPASWAGWRWLHDRRPDIDKLLRAVLDGLTNGGLLRDDARVAAVVVSKVVVENRAPGCSVAVFLLADIEHRGAGSFVVNLHRE